MKPDPLKQGREVDACEKPPAVQPHWEVKAFCYHTDGKDQGWKDGIHHLSPGSAILSHI